MQLEYVLRRVGVFLLTIWLAATVNFFLPRLGGGDPVRQQLVQQAAMGGNIQTGMEGMIKLYDEKFGLNKPLPEQLFRYVKGIASFDLGFSFRQQMPVSKLIMDRLPATLLLTMTAFAISPRSVPSSPSVPAWVLTNRPSK